VRARFRQTYGASPLHLLALIAALLVAGAAVAGWFQSFPGPTVVQVLLWFLGAIVAHDLGLLPLYSMLDRIAFGRDRSRRRPDRRSAAAYIRVPVLLSGLLLLVFFPEIFRLGDHNFYAASGLHQRVFLARFLLSCAALFAASAAAYTFSLRRASASARTRTSRDRSSRSLRSRARAWLARARRTRGGRRRAGTRP